MKTVNNTSLYLAQSCQDAWNDHIRSLNTPSFPTWDYVILTASDVHQAVGFQKQLAGRKGFLPDRTHVAVIPDEGNVRVGSGGATLSVLKYIREREKSFAGKRILVIHSGGDSKRVPQYSALGKLFSPVPRCLPDGRPSALFDECIISLSAVPGRIREGMLAVSGDVLLLFNPLLIDYSGRGAAVISFKEDVRTGKDHGVFLRGQDGFVKRFLHKQSVEELKAAGAVNEAGAVDIDTGALILGPDVLDALYSLISTDGKADPDKYAAFVNEKARLSLYGDFQYPMARDASLEGFYREKPEGRDCGELRSCRRALWDALRPFRIRLLRLAPAKFIHFGTTKEILELMSRGVGEYESLGWSARVSTSIAPGGPAGYNSVVSPSACVGEGCYLEVSRVHDGAFVGEGSILSYVDILDERVPSHVVLHGLKQYDGRFVCRIFGVEDDPRENRLFGKELTGDLWEEGVPHTLWFAKLFPERKTIREAVAYALELYRSFHDGNGLPGTAPPGAKSLAEGFRDADPEAILAWNRRMAELVTMYEIRRMIEAKLPAREGILPAPLSKLQKEWLEDHLAGADYSMRMRLHYYVGKALGDEKETGKAFRSLSDAVLASTSAAMRPAAGLRISENSCSVSLPLRVNWGGGWSDTPPYCNENGGTVLNAAILLNGQRPVTVSLKRLEEKKIVFESRDMDACMEFHDIAPLQRTGDPFDPFVLQKAALLVCGVIPARGGNLAEILDGLGGGFAMDTEVTGVPKGSGLGTSSILAGACIRGICTFFGITLDEADLYRRVLEMEQLMSTGGGWQDQVGGLSNGIKYIRSAPGLLQELRIVHVETDEAVRQELNERFCLIYTGLRRLARNLLRDVVGKYIGNDPDTVYALNEIQRCAALMRFELERGHIDAFAELLNDHWKLSRMIDEGSTNTLIDQIFDAVDDLIAGRMICGAGGGGFLQVVLKKGITKEDLQNRLTEVFYDTDIRVWDCTLV